MFRFSCMRLLQTTFFIFFIGICMPVLADVQKELAKLEARSEGRLGIFALNTANNKKIQYHANERFPMGCTSKVIGVAAVLKKSMTDKQLLQEKIVYQKNDLLSWAPITKKHLKDGMTICELCAAAISYSDNTAMNLLVKKLGGLQEFNNFARSIGDMSFKVDNWWPQEAMSGPDGKDSTTPAAMAKSLQKLALGDVLAISQRKQLQDWLKDCTTGQSRIRAGVPQGWIVGDKTGTGFHYGTTNDIAIIWPPKHAPIVLVVYYTNNYKNAQKREDIIASATRIVLKDFALIGTESGS